MTSLPRSAYMPALPLACHREAAQVHLAARCKDYVLAGLETSYSLITKLALYTSRVYENKHHAFTSALTISVRVCVASQSPSLSCFLFSFLLLLSTLPLRSKSITRYSVLKSLRFICTYHVPTRTLRSCSFHMPSLVVLESARWRSERPHLHHALLRVGLY